MSSGRRTLALVAALTASLLAVPGSNGSATAAPMVQLPAVPSDSLVDAYGVGIHTPFLDTPYADSGRLADALADLGVRHVRDDLFLDNPRQYDAIAAVAERGVSFDLIMGRPDRPGTPADYVRTLAELPEGAVESVEGINEWDHFGRHRDWVTETVAWQRDLYREVKTTPTTAHLPVLSPALAFRRNYADLPDLSPWSDVANAHIYPGGAKPGTEIGSITSALTSVLSSKPLMTTEAGYHNAVSTTNGHRPASERAAGLYLPRLLLEHHARGHQRVYSYELIDEFDDPGRLDPEANFGLLRHDWSPKPAYTAMRTLLGLLADPGPAFATTPLSVRVDGWPTDGRYLVTQKRDGSYVLLMYRDVSVWDPTWRRDLTVAPARVRLQFASDFDITVHRVTDGPVPVGTAHGAVVDVALDGGVTAVTLEPAGAAAPGTVAAAQPEELRVEARRRSAVLTWQLPSGGPAVDGFEIVRLPDGYTEQVPSWRRRWKDRGLVDGDRYRYTVRALSSSGDSAAALSAVVVPASAPGRPPRVVPRARGSRAVVTWRPAPPRGRAVERYRVRVGDRTRVVGPEAGRVVLRGVPRADRVRVVVRARNELGWGPPRRVLLRTH